MEDYKKDIANRIRKLRIEAGLTQEQLAEKLNLSGKSTIANYERGHMVPSDTVKKEMCKVFNCSLDYLMGKQPEETVYLLNGDLKYIEFLYKKSIKNLDIKEKEIIKSDLEKSLNSLILYKEDCYKQLDNIKNDKLLKIIRNDSIIKINEEINFVDNQIQGLKKILEKFKNYIEIT